MTQPITITFQFERKTKMKVRLQEVVTHPDTEPQPVRADRQIVGKLYVTQAAMKKMGDPPLLRVTVEPVKP